jgi:hypothetical protein
LFVLADFGEFVCGHLVVLAVDEVERYAGKALGDHVVPDDRPFVVLFGEH